MSRRTGLLLAVTGSWLLALAVPALADNCGTPSDCFGQAGSFNLAALGLLGLAGASMLLDFVPGVGTAKGVVEAIIGRDLLTGQKLSWWERGLGVVPVVGGLAAVAGIARASRRVADVADTAGDATRTAGRLDDAADTGADVTRVSRIPHGFADAEDFMAFGGRAQQGFGVAGYDDVTLMVRGSAVTGVSHNSGLPFDVGRRSDFDLAVVSPRIWERLQGMDVPLRSGGTRTPPLTLRHLDAMGLTDVVDDLNVAAGRDVSLMVYRSVEDVAVRGPFVAWPYP